MTMHMFVVRHTSQQASGCHMTVVITPLTEFSMCMKGCLGKDVAVLEAPADKHVCDVLRAGLPSNKPLVLLHKPLSLALSARGWIWGFVIARHWASLQPWVSLPLLFLSPPSPCYSKFPIATTTYLRSLSGFEFYHIAVEMLKGDKQSAGREKRKTFEEEFVKEDPTAEPSLNTENVAPHRSVASWLGMHSNLSPAASLFLSSPLETDLYLKGWGQARVGPPHRSVN